jgi:hypothetical protein
MSTLIMELKPQAPSMRMTGTTVLATRMTITTALPMTTITALPKRTTTTTALPMTTLLVIVYLFYTHIFIKVLPHLLIFSINKQDFMDAVILKIK